MKRVLFLLLAANAYCATDVTSVVEQSIRNYQRDWRVDAANWACTETDTTRSDGKTETEVSDVVPIDGTPYDRLVMKDGHPLSAAAQRREQRKFQKVLAERKEETPGERAARIRKYENERSFLQDIPRAYTFQLNGEQVVDGRAAYIVKMRPRPGFIPVTPHGAMLSHLEGTLWIDKQDKQWVQAEAHVIQPISIGWILARVTRGTRFMIRQTRINDSLWLPGSVDMHGSALLMLVDAKPLDKEMTWTGYHQVSGTYNRSE